jgi:hypothetical protein
LKFDALTLRRNITNWIWESQPPRVRLNGRDLGTLITPLSWCNTLKKKGNVSRSSNNVSANRIRDLTSGVVGAISGHHCHHQLPAARRVQLAVDRVRLIGPVTMRSLIAALNSAFDIAGRNCACRSCSSSPPRFVPTCPDPTRLDPIVRFDSRLEGTRTR